MVWWIIAMIVYVIITEEYRVKWRFENLEDRIETLETKECSHGKGN